MCHIDTSIVSRYLATIYCAHVQRYVPDALVEPLPNSEIINHPSSNHTYTKSDPNHIHYHYAPVVTLTYRTHIISSTASTYAPYYHPGFVDRPRRSDRAVCQMDGEAGWWTTSGKIGLTRLANVKGVGRQKQPHTNLEVDNWWSSIRRRYMLRDVYYRPGH